MSFTSKPGTVALGAALVGIAALNARAEIIISLSVNPTTNATDGLDRLVEGDEVWFQIGVDVTVAASNNGLNVLVYDVIGDSNQILSGMQDAFSGFSNTGIDGADDEGSPANVSDNFYNSSDNSISPDYGGGWGFNRAGLYGGGDVTVMPGSIIAAGIAAPLAWTEDSHPNLAGLQPLARLGVGNGAFTFGADDPVLSGLQGGFGFEISGVDNATVITEGDGTWIMQVGHIDTTGWAPGTYSFDINPTEGVVYDGTLDYTTHITGDVRLGVHSSQITGTSFSFTIIPEPAALGLLLVAGLGLVRRRRRRLPRPLG